MREHWGQKKAAKPTTSQQYRLEKPAPGPTNTPVPEAKTPEVAMSTGQSGATEQPATATSIPVDMEISPDEEAELLCGPPDDVDMVFQITSPDPTTLPRHGYTVRSATATPSRNTPLQKLSTPATDPPTHPPEAAGKPPSLFCD
jgi:hypothetical protein